MPARVTSNPFVLGSATGEQTFVAQEFIRLFRKLPTLVFAAAQLFLRIFAFLSIVSWPWQSAW
jgi:hypothetical protein